MRQFKLITDFKPRGDQQNAIDGLVENINQKVKHQVLLGVTGSGKTFTMANVISLINRPALIIAHNKTLAAQLYSEFKQLFPENAVEYFVSYYDYYQPEAYIPSSDTYIEKDSSINDNIDKLRHSATRSLLERNDVIIVASVSCIYGLGSPEAYQGMLLYLEEGREASRDFILSKLVEIQYRRNDIDFSRGTFRVKGDIIEIFPAHEAEKAVRIELFGDAVDSIKEIDPLRGRVLGRLEKITVFPTSHYVTPADKLKNALDNIREELKERVACFKTENKLIEAQRIEQRTLFDLEMLEELGYCNGIENYSRHLTGRKAGEPPPTLLDYFPKNFLLFVDESHQTIPQIGGMYAGDRSRKTTLVEYGFRLPSALDNRPLSFAEFEGFVNQAVYVSATPAGYELQKSKGLIIEQIIRPTGLIDPKIRVKPSKYQVDDLLAEIKKRVEKRERVLVTTLTKRMAEDLTEYYLGLGLKAKYLHSDIDTLERVKIIRDLRLGKFDLLIGINLLREGLDMPEVSLVAVLDADKEGFLRSKTSLIQTCGRAARNINGEVIFYAGKMTKSIKETIAETKRRRNIQKEFNERHNITPSTIVKSIESIFASIEEADYVTIPFSEKEDIEFKSVTELKKTIKKLEKEMLDYAKKLEFEKAAEVRDRLVKLKEIEIYEG